MTDPKEQPFRLEFTSAALRDLEKLDLSIRRKISPD
jgi:mRNA-degrading endonuclease RelE of RelBE toxin-antitoxin system